TVVVICGRLALPRPLLNTMVNGPALLPMTVTLPFRPGMALRLARTSAAVGGAPVVNVRAVPLTPLNTGVNVPALVPPTVSVCTSLPLPLLTVDGVTVGDVPVNDEVVVTCARLALARPPAKVIV